MVFVLEQHPQEVSMLDLYFPAEIPKTDELVRITPIKEDYAPRNYKFFCEESHVVSRFFAVDYGDRRYVEVCLSGHMIRKLRFNLESSTWSVKFDDLTIQVEVEKILE